MEEIIQQTVTALRRGETLLYPTDTIWGIGCDATNADAIRRLYAIKERDRSKSMLILVSEDQVAGGQWPEICGQMDACSEQRPTTYILPREVWRKVLKVPVSDALLADDGSLGVRLPRHAFCQEVIRRLGAPLVSTSANLSGQPSPTTYSDISPVLMERVDFCVPPLPQWQSSETRGSRILRLAPDGTASVLRP